MLDNGFSLLKFFVVLLVSFSTISCVLFLNYTMPTIPEDFSNYSLTTNKSLNKSRIIGMVKGRSDFVIFLNSHSSNHYTWHLTLGLLTKHWRNYKIFWAVDELSLHSNYTASVLKCMRRQVGWTIRTYSNDANLSPRLSILLNSPELMSVEYVLFLLEDWLPVAPAADSRIQNVLRAMDYYGLDHVRHSKIPNNVDVSAGFPMPDPMGLNAGLLPHILWNISTDATYFVNIQPAIWRRKALLKILHLLRDANSFSSMEIAAINTADCRHFFQGRFAALDTNPPRGALWSGIYPHWHAIMAGKWIPNFDRDMGCQSRQAASLHDLLFAYGVDPTLKGSIEPWNKTWKAASGWEAWARGVQSVADKLSCPLIINLKRNVLSWEESQ